MGTKRSIDGIIYPIAKAGRNDLAVADENVGTFDRKCDLCRVVNWLHKKYRGPMRPIPPSWQRAPQRLGLLIDC